MKSTTEEPDHIDFGDVSDLKSIVTEQEKSKTGEFPKVAGAEPVKAAEKPKAAEQAKSAVAATGESKGPPVIGDFEPVPDALSVKRTFSKVAGATVSPAEETSAEEGWPAGKAGAAGNPAARKSAAREPKEEKGSGDRVPEQVVRDERPVGIDPDYELADEEEPAPEDKTEEWFWDQAEKVFPGCLGNKISVKLDPDIWEWFKSKGPNWEDSVNELLREHMEKNS